jgi:asparagine synthase (glutamine-hydrolysing)
MCGICGILNTRLNPLLRTSDIDRMSERLVHRGPDSHGKMERPFVALAIRRLSIIDLKTGDQPLTNEAGDVTLVYNGEIYNFRDLRRKLESNGHRFRSHSDGEVIAHLYEEHGPKFTEALNGMFAIAVWDEKRKRLVLARDRAGEKPLYYWLQNGLLVFASEIKSLLECPDVGRSLDLDAVQQYLFYGYVPSPRSIFREIKRLPAGHRMVVEGGKIYIEPYWSLKDYLRSPGTVSRLRSEQPDLVRELRARLRQAAVSRLISDVPLGVFLSGGVDSSAIAALMSELAPGQVNTFSVAFAAESFNEEPYAALVARRLQTRHHVFRADAASLFDGLQAMAVHLDEPLADPAVIPTFLLSRFARAHIKVALSGEGSDELFGGYPTYFGALFAPYYLHLPRFLRHQLLERAAAFLPVSPGAVPLGLYLRRFFSHVDLDPAERHQSWFCMFSPQEVEEIWSRKDSSNGPASRRIFEPLQDVIRGARCENELAEALYIDFSLYLADDLLVKLDRASMACSLELRTPFLDHCLIEFAAALPGALKVRRFQLKYLLKRAVEPWLPREIVYRQKRGFSVPIAAWLRSELQPVVRDMLSETRLKAQGLFNPVFVRRVMEEHLEEKADHRKTLWTLLMFQLWYGHWVEARKF